MFSFWQSINDDDNVPIYILISWSLWFLKFAKCREQKIHLMKLEWGKAFILFRCHRPLLVYLLEAIQKNGGPFITHRRLWLILGLWRRPRWSSISWEIARQFCILTWVRPTACLLTKFIDDTLWFRRLLHILRMRPRKVSFAVPCSHSV